MISPRIAPAGLALFWASVGAAAIGAIRFDGILILIGSIGLVVLVLARFLAPRNLRGIRIFRDMPSHVYAGEPFEISYSLKLDSPRRLGPFGVAVRDEVLPRGPAGVLWASRIPGGGESAAGIVRTRIFRRGLESRRQFSLTSTFPLGLFEVRASGKFENRNGQKHRGTIVFPRPLLPETLRRQLDLDRFEIAHQQGVDPEPAGDFRGVRMWRPGDPLRTIHWPATARMGSMFQCPGDSAFATLMVRDWDPPGPKPRRFGVLLHSFTRAGRLIRPDRFEAALQIVAGLLIYCRNEDIPIRLTLLAGNSRDGMNLSIPERTRFNEALSRLALVTREPCSKRRSLTGALSAFADCDRVFAISDSPLATWRQAVRHRRSVVCADSESVRIEPPRLKLKPRGAGTAEA